MENAQIIKSLKSMGYISHVTWGAEVDLSALLTVLADNHLGAISLDANSTEHVEDFSDISNRGQGILYGIENVKDTNMLPKLEEYGVDFVTCDIRDEALLSKAKSQNLLVIPSIADINEFELASQYDSPAVIYEYKDEPADLDEIVTLSDNYSIPIILKAKCSAVETAQFLRERQVLAVMGDIVAPESLVGKNDFALIEENAKELIEKILDLSLAHIGINVNGRDESDKLSADLDNLMHKGIRETPISHFVGNGFEIMHSGLGEHGHVALYTNSIELAMRVLAARGYSFLPEYTKKDEHGRIFLSYFTQEFGGFAFHLLQR